ncbi:MAG: radical SAM protein [Deltaproteobacteria bacterium]|jgi:uncharacterized radical SAM superfamily Fe-S cluster-containing enzyme|nr:radical SAM protein [Deltaproteobacteria bacterium]
MTTKTNGAPPTGSAPKILPQAGQAGPIGQSGQAGHLGTEKILSTTQSLCPVCFGVLGAELVQIGDEVFMRRECPEHGQFMEAIWRGEPAFEDWRRPKEPARGLKIHRQAQRGCPFDCGLCPEHAQYPCTVLLEITEKCDLRCPVCFASSGGALARDRDLNELLENLIYVRAQAGPVVLQLSGGEPTEHPGLLEIVSQAAKLFPAVQLNTNGLRLAEDPHLAKELRKRGLRWVFLQFDSLRDVNLAAIRGRPLLERKLLAVENLEKANLPTVLVPTVIKGVNDQELGALVKFATSKPWVRGLHFQPMTASGRNGFVGAQSRLTLPELLKELGRQTDDCVDPTLAFPPGCEHERCSFHLRFRRLPDGTLIPRPGQPSDRAKPPKTTHKPSDPAETEASRDRAVDIILRSWSAGPGPADREQNFEPGSKPAKGLGLGKGLGIPMAGARPPDAFDEFLAQAARESFSLTAMAFQDVWTVDLARLRGCCVHVFDPPDRFVPLCAMNLTSANGRPLYRGQKAQGAP